MSNPIWTIMIFSSRKLTKRTVYPSRSNKLIFSETLHNKEVILELCNRFSEGWIMLPTNEQ